MIDADVPTYHPAHRPSGQARGESPARRSTAAARRAPGGFRQSGDFGGGTPGFAPLTRSYPWQTAFLVFGEFFKTDSKGGGRRARACARAGQWGDCELGMVGCCARVTVEDIRNGGPWRGFEPTGGRAIPGRNARGEPKMLCEVAGCGKPTARIMAGHDFCAHHGEADLRPEVAIVHCKVCGTAVPRPAAVFCDSHAAWRGSGGIPPKAA